MDSASSRLTVRPAFLALLACIGGLVLMPSVQLATDRLDWRLFASAYGYIFVDSFETGDTSRWSATVMSSAIVISFPPSSSLAEDIYDTLGDDGTCFVPASMLPDETVGVLLVEDCRFERAGDHLRLSFRRPEP